MVRKPEMLRIRCHKDTIKELKNFIVNFEFGDYEEGLKALLEVANKNPQLVRKDRIRYV